MPVEMAGFGEQKYEVKSILDLGARLRELEQSIPDPVHEHRIRHFENLYNSFDSLKALLDKAELVDASAVLEQHLDDLYEAYQIFIASAFRKTRIARRFSQKMAELFGHDDLRIICDELEIPEGEIHSTPDVAEFSHWLVRYCQRREQGSQLLNACQQKRSEANWLAELPGDHVTLVSTWASLKNTLQTAVEKELRGRIVITLPPPPPHDRNQLYSVQMVSSRFRNAYLQIPDIAQAFFQEAVNCFACEQFSAATVQAWRAAYVTLYEYCKRANMFRNYGAWREQLAQLEPQGHMLDWRLLVQMIPVADRENDHDPDHGARIHAADAMGRFYASFRLDNQIDKEDAWDLIIDAIELASYLVRTWTLAKRKLLVEVNGELNRDVLGALYLIDRNDAGIGEVIFSKTENDTSLIVDAEPVAISEEDWPIARGVSQHFNLPWGSSVLDQLLSSTIETTDYKTFVNQISSNANEEDSRTLAKLEIVCKLWGDFNAGAEYESGQSVLTINHL